MVAATIYVPTSAGVVLPMHTYSIDAKVDLLLLLHALLQLMRTVK